MSGFQLPVIDIHRGQFNSAQKKLKALLTSKVSQGRRFMALNELIHLYYEMDQYPEMLLTAKELSSKLSEISVGRNFNRLYLGWSFAANMKISEAENQLDHLLKDITVNSSPFLQAIAKYFSAIISFQEGKYEQATEKFRKVYSLLPPNHEPNIFFAITLLKSGQISEAITELQRLKYWPGGQDNYILLDVPGTFGDWPIPEVKAHYWLGVAYERQGEKDNAIKEYKKFLYIWKDADFKSPEIIDAKARVSKLENLAILPIQ
jgi:tetratricopeptide (TPR) repeat protein